MRTPPPLRCAALVLALSLPAASSARADTGAPFACKTVLVDASQEVLSAKPGQQLLEALARPPLSLTRVPSAERADVTLKIDLDYVAPQVVDGISNTAETLAISATLTGADVPVTVTSDRHTLLGRYSRLRPWGRLGGWTSKGPGFVGEQLVPRLSEYIASHSAGLRLTAPPGGSVAIGEGKAVEPPEGGFVVRCRRSGDEVEVTGRLGDRKVTKLLPASTADTPVEVISPVPVAPSSSVTAGAGGASTSSGAGGVSSSSSGTGASGGWWPPQPPGSSSLLLILLLAGAAAGGAWTVQRLGRNRTAAPAPPAPARRVKVLLFAANPSGTAQIRLDEEIRQIRQKLAQGDHRDQIDFQSYPAVRFDDMVNALNSEKPDIVHFSGHGTPDGALVLEGENGASTPLSPQLAERLFAAFATPEDRIRVVVLNACFSVAQAEAIRKVVDVTIGSTRQIADTAAIGFAAGFYRAIAYGRSVRNAYEQGRLTATRWMTEEATAREVLAARARAADGADPLQLLERPGAAAADEIFLVGKDDPGRGATAG